MKPSIAPWRERGRNPGSAPADCTLRAFLNCLTVADEWTKEGLAIEVDGRIRSSRVIAVLSRLVSERGAPHCLRSHNGPEFVSRALLKWIVDLALRPR